MQPRFVFVLVSSAALFTVLSCQMTDLFVSQPTPLPPSPVAARATLVPPTNAPPVTAPASTSPSSAASTVLPPTSQPSAALPPGCANPNATISSLIDNGTVSGLIEIKGTATRADMQYWKLEYRAQNNTAYDVLSRSEKAATDEVLARLSTKTLPNGVYFIRLVIVLKDGNTNTPCEFRVTVQN